MPREQVVRAYRFPLDVTPAQEIVLRRHAGAARWAYNYALALKQQSHHAWIDKRDRALLELSDWTPGQIKQALNAKKGSAARSKLVGYQKQAAARIKPSMDALTAPTRLLDDHRKRVFQMTSKGAAAKAAARTDEQRAKAATDFAKLAATDPITAADYEARRQRLEELQDTDPKAFAAARRSELEAVRGKLLGLKRGLIREGALLPASFDIQALWRETRDRPREEGGSPWWRDGINIYAFQSGFERCDTAWKNWIDSCTGKRKGAPVGAPRFKCKGKAADSFTLFHDTNSPSIKLDGYRRLSIPAIGTIRLHQTAKRLGRLVNRGHAVITSVTLTRGGHRWYASVLAHVEQDIPERPTRRQRATDLIAVDLGSQPLVKLSAPIIPTDPSSSEIRNPKHLTAGEHQLRRAQQALSRCAKHSKNRAKAQQRLAKLHHQVATRRQSSLHSVSKLLATGSAYLAIENLDLRALTSSARGTKAAPGKNVKVEARFNRHTLDAGLGELRRQLEYKTRWYGSTLITLDKGEPTSSKCSRCDERNPNSRPGDLRFACGHCGLDMGRRDNAVRSIYRTARRQLMSAAPDRGSALKAPGGPVSPVTGDGDRQAPMKGKAPTRGPADPPHSGPP
ncbi:RNA-guided endonuclease TnpB family protein [Streptomyces noursei]|uniref:RNA-guided endonuclease TnpB family protein n=1 Tax=Streptomyces noursei TaxID=1971 RepID=UPI0033E8DAD1